MMHRLVLVALLVSLSTALAIPSTVELQSNFQQLNEQVQLQASAFRANGQHLSIGFNAELMSNTFKALASPNLSPDCAAAIEGLQNAQANCPAVIFNSNGNDAFRNFTLPQLTAYCQGTCVSGLRDALRKLVKACPVGDIGAGGNNNNGTSPADFIDNFLLLLRLPCVTSNTGEYCLPSFYTAFDTLQQHQGDYFTDAELDLICVPCLRIYLKILIELSHGRQPSLGNGGGNGGGSGGGGGGGGGHNAGDDQPGGPFGFLQVICVKDKGAYCINKFVNLTKTTQNSSDNNGPPPPPIIAQICQRCTIRVAARLYAWTRDPSLKEFLTGYAQLCVRDEVGNICWVRIYDGFQNVQQSCGDQLSHAQCNSTCSAAISSLITNGGCCTTFLVSRVAVDSNQSPQAFQNGIRVLCNITQTFAPICPRGSTVFAVLLSNLRYQYYQANKAQVDSSIAEDVASEAGVTSDDVQVTSATASADGGTSVSTTVSTVSTQDAGDVNSVLQSSQQSGYIPFAAVSSLPAESRVDLLSPAGGTPTTTVSAALCVQPLAYTFLAMMVAMMAIFL